MAADRGASNLRRASILLDNP